MYQSNLKNNRRCPAIAVSIFSVHFMTLFGLVNILGQSDIDSKTTDVIVGRVFASVSLPTYGVGLGPKYQSLIFQPEIDQDSPLPPRLIRIVFQFFEDKDELRKDFFDYSKKYEIKVRRDSTCDDKALNFAYVGIKGEKTRVRVFDIMKGANSELLNEDEIIPCYILTPSGLKLLTKTE